MHITFICTGNICRSPMAEKIAAAHLEREGLSDVRVTSAGTGSWHVGDPAHENTQQILRKYGYATTHTAACVADDHLDADLVVALDRTHARELAHLGVDPARVRLLRSFDPAADSPDVEDPYYMGIEDYERVRDQIEAAMPGLLDWVRGRQR
jgi:protein-tyrosine phosphatase